MRLHRKTRRRVEAMPASRAFRELDSRVELLEARIPDSRARTRVIERGIAEALELLKPDVARILYDIGEDWIEPVQPSIFFRVLMADYNFERLQEIRRIITQHTHAFECGLYPYFNVRTVKEQEKMKDAKWE
jgi:hypothetical protein